MVGRLYRAFKSLIAVRSGEVTQRLFKGDVADLEKKMQAYYCSAESHEYYTKLDAKGAEDDWRDMARRDQFESLCGQASRFLDFGCGAGNLALAVAEHFPELDTWGIDIGASAAEIAAGKSGGNLSNLHYVEGDLLQSGLDDASYDLITSRFVIEHVVYPQRMLEEAYRILKPGGTLYLVFPHLLVTAELRAIIHEFCSLLRGGNDLTYLDPVLGGEPCGDRDAVWLSNHIKLARMMKSCGFQIDLNKPTQSLIIGHKE